MKLEVEAGSPALFEFTVGDPHGNAVYHFADPDAKLRPFLLGGLGATLFSGGGQASETKLSWGLGGGVTSTPSELWMEVLSGLDSEIHISATTSLMRAGYLDITEPPSL